MFCTTITRSSKLITYFNAKNSDKTCVVRQFYATPKKKCNTFVKII